MMFYDSMRNYAPPQHQRAKTYDAGGGTFIHIHPTTDQEAPAEQSNGNGGEASEVLERLAQLESAVAMLVEEGDGNGEGETGDAPDPTETTMAMQREGREDVASKMAGQERVHRQFTTGAAKDTLPDISDINNRNRKFWAGAANMEEYSPNQGGSIDPAKRLSTVAPKLDMGTVNKFASTADRMTTHWRDQRLATNAVVASINERNRRTYG